MFVQCVCDVINIEEAHNHYSVLYSTVVRWICNAVCVMSERVYLVAKFRN